MGQDEVRRARDVGGDPGAGSLRVAGLDCGAHVGMKPDRITLGEAVGIAAQVQIDHRPGLQPQRADDLDQDRRLRSFVSGKMKGLVEFDGARQVRRGHLALGAHRGFGRGNCRDVVGPTM